MSELVNTISKIHNNPFVFTPLIIEFFKNAIPQHNNILLAYLVLPLVLHHESQAFLLKARSSSSVASLKRKRENLYGLPERVKQYKAMTNLCIQHAIDNAYIQLKPDLSIQVQETNIVTVHNLTNALHASSNLHKVFKEFDVVAIYRLLGVKEL